MPSRAGKASAVLDPVQDAFRAGSAGAASGILDSLCARRSTRSQVGTKGWPPPSNKGMCPRSLTTKAPYKGVGIETADMLVHEQLARKLRDRRAVARYAGLTGAPDESGSRRREKGLARAGNARVRHGMIQLAWRWLMFQKQSPLSQWFQARAASLKRGSRKTLIVALARKLLIELWRYLTTGAIPAGAILYPTQ